MPKLRLTEITVSKIKLPHKPLQTDYWDTLVPAFGLRVSYSGAKAWLVAVRILCQGSWKMTRVSFGKYPEMSLSEARTKAMEIKVKAKQGDDPRISTNLVRSELEQSSRDSFGAVRDLFIRQHCLKKLRPRPAKEYARVLRSQYFHEWESRPISSITKREVISVLDLVAEKTPSHANNTLIYLRSMMNWAVKRDIIEQAPTHLVSPPAKKVIRDRTLSKAEISLLWRILSKESVFGPLLKILLLTGQRREEVAQMRRSELKDLDGKEPMWEIPRERVKMDRPHRVPLSPQVVKIIKSLRVIGDDLVFTTNGETPMSGFSRLKTRLDAEIEKAKISDNFKGVFDQDWVIHDLRRTCATQMAEMGISRDVVELILNHQSGTRSGVAGIYNRSELLVERRRALNLWANNINTLSSNFTLPNSRFGSKQSSIVIDSRLQT